MKKAAFFLIILLISFTFSSCAEREMPSCRDVLGEIIAAEIGLPAGRVYSSKADEGEDEHLPNSLVNVLYGNGSRPVMADGWLDIALFLPSSSHPCEIAVFLCNSEDTATDTARMLLRRLDTLRTANGDSELVSYFDTATVTVMRNYVLFLISSDVESAVKTAAKIIG